MNEFHLFCVTGHNGEKKNTVNKNDRQKGSRKRKTQEYPALSHSLSSSCTNTRNSSWYDGSRLKPATHIHILNAIRNLFWFARTNWMTARTTAAQSTYHMKKNRRKKLNEHKKLTSEKQKNRNGKRNKAPKRNKILRKEKKKMKIRRFFIYSSRGLLQISFIRNLHFYPKIHSNESD